MSEQSGVSSRGPTLGGIFKIYFIKFFLADIIFQLAGGKPFQLNCVLKETSAILICNGIKCVNKKNGLYLCFDAVFFYFL